MELIKREKCVICNCSINEFYCLKDVPITMQCTNKPIFEKNTLHYAICSNCNTIQLNNLIPLNILYASSHNFTSVGNTWKKYFELIVNQLNNITNLKNILEIGCPSGKIANMLNNYNKWFIVEPNVNNNIINNNNIYYIRTFFDKDFTINEKIDLIVHSHLFEHIYEPNIFLKKCYDILDVNGEMFFGIPDMEFMSKDNLIPFMGVMFEHTIFYNIENIKYLLYKNNFNIIETIYYNNHSIIFHTKKDNNINKQYLHDLKIDCGKDCFLNNVEYYRTFIDYIILESNKIKTLNKNIKFYIYAAGYVTQLLLSMGLNIINFEGILDNSSDKQNMYLFGTNLKIFSPKILKYENSVVILKLGIYTDEVYRQLKDINDSTIIIK